MVCRRPLRCWRCAAWAQRLAELLGAQLLPLIFVVVLSDPLLQTVVMRRRLAAIAQRCADQAAAQSAS